MKCFKSFASTDAVKYSQKHVLNNELPVIKLSPEGILLAANSTGVDFLDMLSDFTQKPAIYWLLKLCPQILEPGCNTDFTCRVYDSNFHFSAVAFEEGGYIGIYGFRLVHLPASDSRIAS